MRYTIELLSPKRENPDIIGYEVLDSSESYFESCKKARDFASDEDTWSSIPDEHLKRSYIGVVNDMGFILYKKTKPHRLKKQP